VEGTPMTMTADIESDPAQRLIAVDPAMERVVRAAGPVALRPPASDYFNALARSIVFQQLAGKAALAIHTRFAALCGGNPTADLILQMEDTALRGCGLSANKVAAIRDLARKTADGIVPLERIEKLDDLGDSLTGGDTFPTCPPPQIAARISSGVATTSRTADRIWSFCVRRCFWS